MQFKYAEMSAAFCLKGSSRKAALLIHGFLATPYIMRSMGHILQIAGYTVKAICLPGHGTVFTDLRHANAARWQDAVNTAVAELQAEFDEVIIVGFSLGAILGLIAAFRFKIQKLVLLSPAFKISFLAELLKFLNTCHILHLLPDFRCTQSEKINFGSYQRFPPAAVLAVQNVIDQYHLALQQQKSLPHIYVAASAEDATVKFQGMIEAMHNYAAPSRFRIYTDAPQKIQKKLLQGNINVIDVRQFARIHAFSHVALPVAPDDPYLGATGHYYGTLAENIVFAEPTWKDRGKPIRRLTYNPDFQAMAEDILKWLDLYF